MTSRVNQFGQPIGLPVEGWTPRPPPPRQIIEGRYCQLQPLDAEQHADALFRAFAEGDGSDWTYLPDEQPVDPSAYRALMRERETSRDPLHFAIVVAGEPLGTAAFMRIEPVNGVIEIGHVAFAPRLQRTRAGTEAIVLLLRQAFDGCGYRRVEWKCDALNAPSRRAALRYGFSFEGIFRKAVVVKGRNRDTSWFSLVDDDWPARQSDFAAWLYPANFDASGRQVRELALIRGGS